MNKITALALSFLLLHFITKPTAYTYYSSNEFKVKLTNPSKSISVENAENWSVLVDFNLQGITMDNLENWEGEEQVCT